MANALTRERRASRRVAPVEGGGMQSARLRPGRTAYVVDLSDGGALIETDCRLLPGTKVELHLGESPARLRVTGRILRCHVSALDRERIRYRGAVAFEERLCFPGTYDPWGRDDPGQSHEAKADGGGASNTPTLEKGLR